MQRKAYVPGLAALLVALLAGCTADSGTEGSAIDSKAGKSTSSVAQPGKYRTLREPCGSVPGSTLKDLLPGAAELPEEQRQKIFRGTSAVTYDTDRRVGCSWKADSPDASHHLSVDFERVVSYDGAVSDDDRAQEVFATKQDAANLPIPANSAATDADGKQGQVSPPPTPSTSKPATGTPREPRAAPPAAPPPAPPTASSPVSSTTSATPPSSMTSSPEPGPDPPPSAAPSAWSSAHRT